MTPHEQLEAGVRFLLRRQDTDGAWRDFYLRPGRSDAWTTAFVAMRLLSSARGSSRRPVEKALQLAERFLQGAREPRGGWAYNRRCPTDADSTACVLLFLSAVSAAVYPKDYAVLARFQLESGGFATYRFSNADHHWCIAHPEVSATALRALSNFLPPDHFRIRNGIAWLTQYLARHGTGSSYWWLSPRYFAVEVERLRLDFPVLPSCNEAFAEFRGCFDLALGLELGSGAARDHAAGLLQMQDDDGGWPSSPVLRIPDPHRPADDPAVPVAMDDRRLLTTAAAVSALCAMRTQRRARRRELRPAAALSRPA